MATTGAATTAASGCALDATGACASPQPSSPGRGQTHTCFICSFSTLLPLALPPTLPPTFPSTPTFFPRSGYGGYGDWKRGARVIVLHAGDANATQTYVRLEDGNVADQGQLW